MFETIKDVHQLSAIALFVQLVNHTIGRVLRLEEEIFLKNTFKLFLLLQNIIFILNIFFIIMEVKDEITFNMEQVIKKI